MADMYKIRTRNKDVFLRVAKGHFATMHSHTNYYIDVTTQKTRLSEASAVAKQLVSDYRANTIIDTVLCLDGTEVIGACVANELTKNDYLNINAHQTIYVISPEFIGGGQMIFRDNLIPMLTNKHVLVTAASVTTGKSALAAISHHLLRRHRCGSFGDFRHGGRVRRSPGTLDFQPQRFRRLQKLQASSLPQLSARRKNRGAGKQLRLFCALIIVFISKMKNN